MVQNTISNLKFKDFQETKVIQMKQGDTSPIAIQLDRAPSILNNEKATIYLSNNKGVVMFKGDFAVYKGVVAFVINTVLPTGSYSLQVNYLGKKYPSIDSYYILINPSADIAPEDIKDLDTIEMIEDLILQSVNSKIHEQVSNSLQNEVATYIDNNIEILKGEKGQDGIDGVNGSDGKSAYQIAIDNGYSGDEQQWLESLKGRDGKNGIDGRDGASLTFDDLTEEQKEALSGKDGKDGINGESVVITGIETDSEENTIITFSDGISITIPKGLNGLDGKDGKSAFDIAKENGYSGTEEEWLESLKAEKENYEMISDEQAESIFIEEMNKKLKQLGCTNTTFFNSTGLTAAGQLSTAYDFNIITLHASGYNEITNIWGQKSYTMQVTGDNNRSLTVDTTVTSPTLENFYKIIGGKTGTVGIIRNLTSIIYDKGNMYIGTVMRGSTDRFNDLKIAMDEAIKKDKGEPYDVSLIGESLTSFSIMKYPMYNSQLFLNMKPEILLSNRESVKQNPASMTKLMTAIVMLENMENINQTITFKESDFVGGSGVALQSGDIITLRDAMYTMMLSSSNDTAKAVSRVIGHQIYRDRNK